MRLLMDISATRYQQLPERAKQYVAGQLLTPLTQYRRWSETFSVDNGAYTRFWFDKLRAILTREDGVKRKCLWVAVPDVVGSARRTMEVWKYRYEFIPDNGWPLALVVQDGAEDISIPWEELACIFVGGTTTWKLSDNVVKIIKAAKIMNKHVHIGRVNTPRRWNYFDKLGADTCDGSGFARFDWMLERLVGRNDHPLFLDDTIGLHETTVGNNNGGG